jgi:hypothetical protein
MNPPKMQVGFWNFPFQQHCSIVATTTKPSSMVPYTRHWRNWISAWLSTASTHVLLNGQPGNRIVCHARGLCQFDPLLPLLSVLTMEPLNAMFHLADGESFFTSLRSRAIHHRLSLYADDLVVFLAPTARGISLVRGIVDIFAITPIECTCTEEQVALTLQLFPCQLAHFPCRYLGVPLSVHKLSRADMQPSVDAVADWLPPWKSRFMSRVGHKTLVQVTLSAMPVHVSIVIVVYSWILKATDKLWRAFFSVGTDSVRGGQCLVAWDRVTRPVKLGV